MRSLSADQARALVLAMKGKRILVVGDVMLDEFVWGRVARISPEAPVPVVEVTGESFHVGGAGNVARNVRSLGGRSVLAGVVGRDAAAKRIEGDLSDAGVGAQLSKDGGRPTTVKTRIIANHQQLVRTDREQSDDVPGSVEADVLKRIARSSGGCGAIIVSDYQKGVVTPRVMRGVLAAARSQRIPVLVDPKVRHWDRYGRVAVITPNELEAEQATGIRIRGAADLNAVGKKILATLRCGAVLLTRGEHGMSLFQAGRPPVHVPAAAREVFDVTGAGDTVIATLALALCAGAELEEAAVLANHAAGVVVGKLGTATVGPEELIAAVAN